MKGKAKPKRESKKPKQGKKPSAKMAPSPDFMQSIVRKGWHVTPYGGAA